MNESINESTELPGDGFGKNESLINQELVMNLLGESHRKHGMYEFLLAMMSCHPSHQTSFTPYHDPNEVTTLDIMLNLCNNHVIVGT
jgi:hypothetical protein